MNPDKHTSIGRRVVVIYWKEHPDNPFQVFSNLKNFCASYPQYNYNTLNNYLSKSKRAYENEQVRIERKNIITDVVKPEREGYSRQMVQVVKKGLLKDMEQEDWEYWRTKSVKERAAAVTFIISQSLKPGQRMDKSFVQKMEVTRLMTLAKDFEDFVQLLNQYRVEYLVVGGYALAFHGTPRHTGDLDIWIGISDTNAEKMLQVIKDFGLGSLGFTKSDFLREGFVSQIGYPPLRIDILNSIDGVDFTEAFQKKLTIQLESDLSVDYISLGDLILNKQSTGRSRDLSDVKELQSKAGKNPPPKKRKGP